MIVRYVGQYSGVVVPLPFGGEAEVAQGKTLNTTDDHGAALLLQPANWESAKQAKEPTKATVASEEDDEK